MGGQFARALAPERLRGLGDRTWPLVVGAVLIAMFTWDPVTLFPRPGLDQSWTVGLSMAADRGLDHGTDLIFTYGPLGFLERATLAGSGINVFLGAVYIVGLRVAFAFSLLWIGRRNLGLPLAVVLAVVVSALCHLSVMPIALATVWALVALQRDPPPWSERLILLGGGAFCALELLVKINVGIAVLVLLGITALALEGNRLRNVATFAGSFLATAIVLWIFAAQGLGNFDDYVSGSRELISGYSAAMQEDHPNVEWDLVAALVIAAATIAATVLCTGGLPRLRRAAALAVVGLGSFVLFKQGFVRQAPGHIDLYVGAMTAPWIALAWRDSERLVAVGGVAVLALLSWPMTGIAPTSNLHATMGWDQVRTLVDPGRRGEWREAARTQMRAHYALDPAIIRRIGDEPVHISPYEIGLAWAYDLNWDPLPVFQDYAAYTPELDRTNAEDLVSEDGPRYLLRNVAPTWPGASIDGRYQPFEAPATTRATLCNFHEVLTSGHYQLLERSPGNRCGEPRLVEQITADLDQPVAVPQVGPDEALFARVEGAGPGGIEALRSLMFRAAIREVFFNGRPYRLLGENAVNGLLISAPASADFPPPFALAPNAPFLTFKSLGGFASSKAPVEIEFYAVPISSR